MELPDFLAALADLKERFVWFEDECGQLRAVSPHHPDELYSTITALCAERTRTIFCPLLAWEDAARKLELSLEDASQITSAEDRDSWHDKELAHTLRLAVGVTPCPD